VLRLIVGALSPTDAFFAALTCCAIRNAIFSRFTSSKMAPHQRLACPRFTLAPSDVVASVARLRWMKAHLPAFCRGQAELVCEEAARRGSLAILKEAREMGLAWDSSTCDAAAQSGNLAVLQWLRSQGCQWSEATCAQAALHGHLEVLQWMRAGLPSKERCPWDEDTCAAAAEGGHMHILKWARVRKCMWDHRTCTEAAAHGHMELLIWARKNNCRWDEQGEACVRALEEEKLETFWWSAQNGGLGDAEGDFNGLYSIAAGGGHVDVLNFLYDRQFAVFAGTIDDLPMRDRREIKISAAGAGKADVLQWLVDKDLLFDPGSVLRYAIEGAPKESVLDVLNWADGQPPAVKREFQWAKVFDAAADAGNMEVLQWAASKALPWSEHTCQKALRGNHLECLIWLRERGCPWGAHTLKYKRVDNPSHLPFSKAYLWALENGAPEDPDSEDAAYYSEHETDPSDGDGADWELDDGW